MVYVSLTLSVSVNVSVCQSDSCHSSCADGGAAEEAQEVRRGLTWFCAIKHRPLLGDSTSRIALPALLHLPTAVLAEA